jgi:hypothetical protein
VHLPLVLFSSVPYIVLQHIAEKVTPHVVATYQHSPLPSLVQDLPQPSPHFPSAPHDRITRTCRLHCALHRPYHTVHPLGLTRHHRPRVLPQLQGMMNCGSLPLKTWFNSKYHASPRPSSRDVSRLTEDAPLCTSQYLVQWCEFSQAKPRQIDRQGPRLSTCQRPSRTTVST